MPSFGSKLLCAKLMPLISRFEDVFPRRVFVAVVMVVEVVVVVVVVVVAAAIFDS